MGNCVLKGLGVVEEMVKVVTPSGGVMELYAPITAECIISEFPGYGVFLSPHRISQPLLHRENLCACQYYYLLPLHCRKITATTTQENNIIINSSPNNTSGASYRMSVDNQGRQLEATAQVFPIRSNNTGVWKVRLAINTDQLSEILSQDARTEALIESVRAVAKCAAVNSNQLSWTTNSATDHA